MRWRQASEPSSSRSRSSCTSGSPPVGTTTCRGATRWTSTSKAGDLDELAQPGSLDSVDLHIAVRLSDFGKDVSYERPAEYEPLEKLFESFFSGIG